MFKTVKAIYPEEEHEQVFESLEFIQILIHKFCHIAYGQDLPNKVAMNMALQIVIKELPALTIRNNFGSIFDAIYHVLNISHEQLVYQVEMECRATLDLLLEKVGLYKQDLLGMSFTEAEKEY